jgi:hypothetical protein
VFLYVEDRQEVMGCCWSLLELRFLQAEYIRIPEETFSLLPERDERDLSVHIARDCLEIKKLSQGTCQPCSSSNLLTIHITDGDFSRKYVCLKELGKGSYSTVKLGLEIVRFQEVVPPLTATGN